MPYAKAVDGREVGAGDVYRRVEDSSHREGLGRWGAGSAGEAGAVQHHGQCRALPPTPSRRPTEVPAGAGSIGSRLLDWVQHQVTSLVTLHCEL